MQQIMWNGVPYWDINGEVRVAVNKTISEIGEAELQKIRGRKANILEVTYSLEDLKIPSNIKLEDVWDYISVPHTEVGHFVIGSSIADLYHNGGENHAKSNGGKAYKFNYDNQTITVDIVVVYKEHDIMYVYSDDVGYGWAVPLNAYPTIDDLYIAEANFNNGSCIIEKKGA